VKMAKKGGVRESLPLDLFRKSTVWQLAHLRQNFADMEKPVVIEVIPKKQNRIHVLADCLWRVWASQGIFELSSSVDR